jgi:uncharacterized protein (TIGR03435 family)
MTRLAAILVAIGSVSLTAAQQTAPVVQFEVASVKVNTSPTRDGNATIPPSGLVSFTNVELREIVILAFEITRETARFALTGASGGIMRTRFDIRAKPADDVTPGQVRAMLRALLTQRFGLRTHTETRDVPVYALKVANSGRFGPNFRPSQHNCDEFVKAMRREVSNPVEPSDAHGTNWCRSYPGARDGIFTVRGAGTIAQLILGMQNHADRPVIDMTGLSGNFEWEVKFVPASLSRAVTPSSKFPEMITAFREQLGLTLEPQIGPSEVLVIERVEMPTPD